MKQDQIPELERCLPADEETVEKMANEYPILSEEEKERIFRASERKYRMKMGEASPEIAKVDTEETQHPVSANLPQEEVPPCPVVAPKRRYRAILEMAACLLVVVGVVSGFAIPLSKQRGTEDSEPPKVTSDIQTTADARQTTAVTKETVISTAPVTTTTIVTTTALPQDRAELEQHMQQSVIPELLNALCEIRNLSCGVADGFLNWDVSECFDVENRTYGEVSVDPETCRFTSLAEIRSYLDQYLTKRLIQKNFSNMVDGNLPFYTERNGVLYSSEPLGSVIGPTKDSIEQHGFTYVLETSDPEAVSCRVKLNHCTDAFSDFQVRLVLVDGVWKMDEIYAPIAQLTYGYVNQSNPDQILNSLLRKDWEISDWFVGSSRYMDPNQCRCSREICTWTDEYGNLQRDPYSQTWYRSLDSRFSNMAELERYLRSFYSQKMMDQYRDDERLFCYRDFDNVLYVHGIYGKDQPFGGWDEGPAELVTVTPTTIVAKKRYYDYGELQEPKTVTCIKEADGWKIDSIEW